MSFSQISPEDASLTAEQLPLHEQNTVGSCDGSPLVSVIIPCYNSARYLAETRNFAGTVHFIFQPAEESGGGGEVMVKEGLFEKFPADEVYALHNVPGMKLGEFAARVGPMMAAILVATAGVLLMSTKPGGMVGGIKPTLIGLASGGMFALSAIGFRGAILSLHLPAYAMSATFTLTVGIAIQAVVLSLYLGLRAPQVLRNIFLTWKPSLSAGFAGAVASQFWFLAFALATAASVRTLALIEVVFAQIVARVAFGQRTSAREVMGMLLVAAGVGLLLWAY